MQHTFIKKLFNFSSYLLIILSLVIGIVACDSKKDDDHSPFGGQDIEDDFASIAELVGDSVNGNKVSKECAVICYKIDKVSESIERVQSPSSLIDIKKDYAKRINSAETGNDQLIKDEQAIVNARLSETEEEYRKACRDYEVPASGVIQNLQDLIVRIDKVANKKDFYRFQDCRYGMLQDLDNIHLCVEQNSKKIPEVKRLAQILKNKYESKKNELGIE